MMNKNAYVCCHNKPANKFKFCAVEGCEYSAATVFNCIECDENHEHGDQRTCTYDALQKNIQSLQGQELLASTAEAVKAMADKTAETLMELACLHSMDRTKIQQKMRMTS